jgi:hypothetical protein
MSSIKAPMSTSYKAVFAFSLFMMLFVIIVGGATGSKTSGFGIWYWGYTAWKMYKRDNDSLVSLQKIMLWFQAVAFSVALAVLLFSDSDVKRYVDITPVGLIILASLSTGVTYLLYKFFKKQQIAPATSSSVNTSSIEDRFWEQASRELEGDRHEATWARAMASAEGDDAKTKALYIKIRSSDLQRSYASSNELKSNSGSIKDGVLKEESNLFWSSFNSVGKVAIVGIVTLVCYAIYDSTKSSDQNSSIPTTPVNTSNQVSKPTIPEKPIKSIDEVKNLCYVYWDGIRWQLGKTEGDNFARYSRDRYGVVLVELAIPKQMANEFNVSNKVDEKIKNRRFDEFLNTYWHQVETLCKFN